MTEGASLTRKMFVGIKVPPTLARMMASFWNTDLIDKYMLWSDPDDLHITLKFIGSVETSTVDRIEDDLGRLRFQTFKVILDGAGTFEDVGVLFVKIEKSKELSSLQEAIDEAMLTNGIVQNDRGFTPHISLAREESRASNHAIAQHDLVSRLNEFLKTLPSLCFTVERFVLYETVSGHYQVTRQFDLGR